MLNINHENSGLLDGVSMSLYDVDGGSTNKMMVGQGRISRWSMLMEFDEENGGGRCLWWFEED